MQEAHKRNKSERKTTSTAHIMRSSVRETNKRMKRISGDAASKGKARHAKSALTRQGQQAPRDDASSPEKQTTQPPGASGKKIENSLTAPGTTEQN